MGRSIQLLEISRWIIDINVMWHVNKNSNATSTIVVWRLAGFQWNVAHLFLIWPVIHPYPTALVLRLTFNELAHDPVITSCVYFIGQITLYCHVTTTVVSLEICLSIWLIGSSSLCLDQCALLVKYYSCIKLVFC